MVTEVGFIINLPKSQVIPTQTFDFVGYNFRLAEGLVAPTASRIEDLVLSCQNFLEQEFMTPRQLMQVIGKMALVEKVVLHGRIHLRPFTMGTPSAMGTSHLTRCGVTGLAGVEGTPTMVA